MSLFCTYNSVSQEKELFDLIITDENATPELLPEKAISFKKNVYKKINEIFIPMINNFNASNYN